MSDFKNAIFTGIFTAVIFNFVCKFIFNIWKSIYRSYKTGNYKELYSSKRTGEYYKKRSEITARYCKDGLSSFTKKTGIYSDNCRREMEALDNEYAIPGSQEYKNIKEREKKHDRYEREKF